MYIIREKSKKIVIYSVNSVSCCFPIVFCINKAVSWLSWCCCSYDIDSAIVSTTEESAGAKALSQETIVTASLPAEKYMY